MTDVRYEVRDRIAHIALCSPPVNALTLEMLDSLLDGFRRAAADDSVRAVILCSELPSYFSAGLDLDAVLEQSGAGVRAILEKLYVELSDAQHNLGKPSVAAVSGAARGGGMTLAISCNVIVAGAGATFGYPEVNVGVIPAIHYVHLPRIVGRHRAFELLFTGRAFGAEEAAGLGLVSRVAADDAVLAEAEALAHIFAGKSPTVMRQGHAAFMRANDLDYRREVATAVETFCNVAATEDAREGLRAFVEKRRPEWGR